MAASHSARLWCRGDWLQEYLTPSRLHRKGSRHWLRGLARGHILPKALPQGVPLPASATPSSAGGRHGQGTGARDGWWAGVVRRGIMACTAATGAHAHVSACRVRCSWGSEPPLQACRQEATELLLEPAEAISGRRTLLFRGGPVQGHLYRLTLTLLA